MMELCLINRVLFSISLVMICSCCGNAIYAIIYTFAIIIIKLINIVVIIITNEILVTLLCIPSPYSIIIYLF